MKANAKGGEKGNFGGQKGGCKRMVKYIAEGGRKLKIWHAMKALWGKVKLEGEESFGSAMCAGGTYSSRD